MTNKEKDDLLIAQQGLIDKGRMLIDGLVWAIEEIHKKHHLTMSDDIKEIISDIKNQDI